MTGSTSAVISTLARLSEQLAEIAVNIRSMPSVAAVRTAITPRRYVSGDRVECYVDAALHNDGNSVGAWLKFRFENGSWVVESSIRQNTAAGEDKVVGLPTRYAANDEELASELEGASQALARAVESLDFETM